MNGRELARRRRWADIAVIVTGSFVVGWGIWLYPQGGPEVRQGTLWWAHAVGGTLALTAVGVALKSVWLARALLLLSGVILIGGFVAAFGGFSLGGFLTALLPGIILLAAVPFIGPMPVPEQEGKVR
jgi:hypothetical protein